MEIFKELPRVEYILVPIGGGGLATGVSTLAKLLNPKIKVIGVEPVSYTHLDVYKRQVDARAEHLVQFAKMGSIYMEHVVGVKNPKVALVNIGAEEEKGLSLIHI